MHRTARRCSLRIPPVAPTVGYHRSGNSHDKVSRTRPRGEKGLVIGVNLAAGFRLVMSGHGHIGEVTHGDRRAAPRVRFVFPYRPGAGPVWRSRRSKMERQFSVLRGRPRRFPRRRSIDHHARLAIGAVSGVREVRGSVEHQAATWAGSPFAFRGRAAAAAASSSSVASPASAVGFQYRAGMLSSRFHCFAVFASAPTLAAKAETPSASSIICACVLIVRRR